MKIKNFIIILLILILVSQIFAFGGNGSLSRQEKLFFSQLDKEFLEESKDETWVTFIKQIEGQKISLKFPDQPKLTHSNKTAIYSAEDGDVRYQLSIEDHLGEETLVQNYAYWDQGKYCQKQVRTEGGKKYTFLTTSTQENPQKHDLFTQSFHIISPLGG